MKIKCFKALLFLFHFIVCVCGELKIKYVYSTAIIIPKNFSAQLIDSTSFKAFF